MPLLAVCNMHQHKAAVPIAGLVSAALISEPRAHEHVFVDPSTQAVDV